MKRMDTLDKHLICWLQEHGFNFLQYSVAIVFIWFGALKPLGVSPAADLVAKTVFWFDPSWFVPFLGIWEVAIGVCILYRPFVRFGLFLMALQMAGTFLPLIIVPQITFAQFPFVLTIEGQYIIKNLVLIGAGMVIGSHTRDKLPLQNRTKKRR